MSNFKQDIDAMEEGVRMLLGKVAYTNPEPVAECNHNSDGFVYEEGPYWFTLRCGTCTLLYNVDKNGNKIQL